MPLSIHFATIADAFRVPLRLQSRSFFFAFESLNRLLATRLRATEQAERATRGVPTFLYWNGALSVVLSDSLRGALAEAPAERRAPRIGEVFAAGGQAFFEGIGWIGTAIEQELVLPNLLDSLVRTLGIIDASVGRFLPRPPANLFDPRVRTASDLFGEAALAFRTLATSQGELRRFLRTKDQLSEALGGAGAAAADGGGGGIGLTGPERGVAALHDITRYIVAGILGLPLIGELLRNLLGTLDVLLREEVLSTFTRLERMIQELRREAILGLTYGLNNFLWHTMNYVDSLWQAIKTNLTVYLGIIPIFVDDFIDSFETYFRRLMVVFNGVIHLFNGIYGAISAIMDFDLLPVLLPLPALLMSLLPSPPRFTIGDLVATMGRGAMVGAAVGVSAFLGTVDLAMRTSPPLWLVNRHYKITRRTAALRRVLWITALTPQWTLEETGLIGSTLPTFSDIGALVRTGAPDLFLAVAHIEEGARQGLGGLLQRTQSQLDRLGRDFDGFADAAAQAPAGRLRHLALRSVSAADLLLGDQRTSLLDALTQRRITPLEAALTASGFGTIGNAIPAYVAGMDRWWQETASTRARVPTSPHKLNARMRVGRVNVPRLVVRAPQLGTTPVLGQETAERVRASLLDAYRDARWLVQRSDVTP